MMKPDSFPINTYVASLFSSDENSIFQKSINYHIPIYQRPYSWDEEQISRFLDTLLENFTSSNDTPIFFGTMQYNVDGNNKDIVDGQQRMTTFVLFLTLLCSIAGNRVSDYYSSINIDCSELTDTIVNRNELCKKSLKKVKGLFQIPNNYNKYEANYILLYLHFKEYFEETKDELKKKNIIDLESYAIAVFINIVKNVYFVVMETEKNKMSLSEIVKVFNTINTTGMDLNAADIFKLRFYDYHRQSNREGNKNDDALMEDINRCFECLREANPQVEMSYVLTIYKHILCAAAEKPLGFAVLKKSNEAFFEWLFHDSDLCKDLEDFLSVESFGKLVRLTADLYRYSHDEATGGIHGLAELIISETRYSRYWTIPYIYSFFKLKEQVEFHFDLDADKSILPESFVCTYDNALKVAFSAAKYFIVYSVVYDKVINHVQNKICGDFLPSFIADEFPKLIVEDGLHEEFKKRLIYDLKNNDKRAYIVCLFSAIIDEINHNTELSDIRKILFNWNENPIDIEHIEAKNNWDNFNEEERSLYNGIGNLVVLERRINRDIKDKPVELKIDYYKGQVAGKDKAQSCFVSVKDVCRLFDERHKWDIDIVTERAEAEYEKITKLVFDKQ